MPKIIIFRILYFLCEVSNYKIINKLCMFIGKSLTSGIASAVEKKGGMSMKKNSFVILMFMVLNMITIFAEGTFITTNYRDRNMDVQIEILDDGDVKLSWSAVPEAVSYKIYSGDTPNPDNFELFIELDSSHLFHQFTPDSEREFYHMTYTYNTGGGTVTDIDGNVYQTLIIGNQEWMIENLKVTHYRNGDPIPYVTDNWFELTTGAYSYYHHDSTNIEIYGMLYNWYAVDDARGLAPEGWHVPTDEEIIELEMYLGMEESVANSTGWRGTNEGSKLAGGYDLWNSSNLIDDPEFGSSGFNLLPGGYHADEWTYYLGYHGTFWSSIEVTSSYAWTRRLEYTRKDVRRHDYDKNFGFSVRCVKDME